MVAWAAELEEPGVTPKKNGQLHITRPDKDSGLHPPIICLSRLSDFLLLDVAPSLLLLLLLLLLTEAW